MSLDSATNAAHDEAKKVDKLVQTDGSKKAYATLMDDVKSVSAGNMTPAEKQAYQAELTKALEKEGTLPGVTIAKELEVAHARARFNDFEDGHGKLNAKSVRDQVKTDQLKESLNGAGCKTTGGAVSVDAVLTKQVEKDFEIINSKGPWYGRGGVDAADLDQALDSEAKKAKEYSQIKETQKSNEEKFAHPLLDKNSRLFKELDDASNDGEPNGTITRDGVDKFLRKWDNPNSATKDIFDGDPKIRAAAEELKKEFDKSRDSDKKDSIVGDDDKITTKSMAEGMGQTEKDLSEKYKAPTDAKPVEPANPDAPAPAKADVPPTKPDAPEPAKGDAPAPNAGGAGGEKVATFIDYGRPNPGEGPAQILMRLSKEYDHDPKHSVEYRGKQFDRMLKKLDGHYNPRTGVGELLKDDPYFKVLQAEYEKRHS